MRPEPNEVQQLMLKNLIVLGFYHPQTTFETLLHWLRVTTPQDIRSIETIRSYFEQDFFSSLNLKSKEALRNRLSGLISSQALYKSLCAKQCSIDFSHILQNQEQLVVKASIGIVGSYVAKTLGNIILSLLYLYAFKRLSSKASPAQFHVYIDETQYYATRSLSHALTGARQTGLSYCLAYQEFSQEGISPSLRRTIMLETAVKIFGHMRAEDQRAAEKVLHLSEKKCMDKLKPGMFYISSGTSSPSLFQFSSSFSISPAYFSSCIYGRKFMNQKALEQLKTHLHHKQLPQTKLLHYQWNEETQDKQSPTVALNFSLHGTKIHQEPNPKNHTAT